MADPADDLGVVAGDTAAALDFLKHWDGGGQWVLTAIDPDTRRTQTQCFRADQSREAEAWITWQQGKRNIYFSVNRIEGPLKDKKAKKEDIKVAVALHCDVDPPKVAAAGDSSDALRAQQDAILARLESFSPRPSVCLFSGGGYQAFWLLADGGLPIDNDVAVRKIEGHNRWLIKQLNGDGPCWNLDRIMRLPGTINVPDKKKRAAGRVRALAGIVWADWDKRYTLESFGFIDEEKPAGTGTADGVVIPRRDLPDWVHLAIANGAGGTLGHERGWGGDRSRAVFSVACALVRCGWLDNEISAVLLDRDNGISEHVLEQPGSSAYALRQAANARAKVGEGFEMAGNRIAPSPGNLRIMLMRLGIELGYNAFNMQYHMVGPGDVPRRRVGDAEVRRIWFSIIERWPIKVTLEFVREFIFDESMRNVMHPVREYLDGLKWDGVKRVENWLAKYGGATDNEYTRIVGKILLVAAVRRVRQPGCKFDEMVILESAQGTQKSTALACLAVNEEWFSDSVPLDKDEAKVIEALGGRWIVEASELTGLRGAKVEHLKAMLGRQRDTARLAWGRLPTELARQCVIVGTTNNAEYLRDLTGNRRYWPVSIVEFDIDALRRDRDQIWAEASVCEGSGFAIRLPRDFWGMAASEQSKRMVEDPWIDVIESVLLKGGCRDGGKIFAADMWDVLNVSGAQRNQEANVRLGESMRALGWERKQGRIEGRVSWCYVKGDRSTDLRQKRVMFYRTEMDGWRCRLEGVTGSGDRNPPVNMEEY